MTSKAPTPPPSENGEAVKGPEPPVVPLEPWETSLSVEGSAIALTKLEAAYLISAVESFIRLEPDSLCHVTMKSLLPRLGHLVGQEKALKMLHCDTTFIQNSERTTDERD